MVWHAEDWLALVICASLVALAQAGITSLALWWLYESYVSWQWRRFRLRHFGWPGW